MKQRNVKSYPLDLAAWLVEEPMEQREQKVSLLTLCRVVTEVNEVKSNGRKNSSLLCMDDSNELLVLRDGRLETQHWSLSRQ